MKKIKLLYKLIQFFGAKYGIILFYKINTQNTENIKILSAKYSIKLRPKTSDLLTFFQLFIKKDYDFNFGDPKYIIDGGSNIGLFAVLIKNKYPDSEIICIEPDDENFDVLEANMKKYNNIHFEKKGIWNKKTSLKVSDKFNLGKDGMIVEEDLQHGTVQAIDVNYLLAKYNFPHIDVLKLDIEGSEAIVFSENYQSWLPKVNFLVIELHDRFQKDCSKIFFNAINNTIDYRLSLKGENIFIENLNFKKAAKQ